MIKINKQLTRPDGGSVSSGSLVKYVPRFIKDELTVSYTIQHYFSQTALDSGKPTIPGVTDFKYKLIKVCTQSEYDLLNDSGAPLLVEDWLKDLIDDLIGVGNTEII